MTRESLKKLTGKLFSQEVKVRSATTSDLGGMSSLLGELFSIEKDFTPDVRRQRRGLATLMESRRATILVAEAGSQIIGMCTLQPLISTAEGGTVGMVEDMIIAESWRGKGVGRMLLDAIETEAREQQMSRLQLLTDLDNEPAKKFYRNQHWSPTQLITMRKLFQ